VRAQGHPGVPQAGGQAADVAVHARLVEEQAGRIQGLHGTRRPFGRGRGRQRFGIGLHEVLFLCFTLSALPFRLPLPVETTRRCRAPDIVII
jgi:hypothetical protein